MMHPRIVRPRPAGFVPATLGLNLKSGIRMNRPVYAGLAAMALAAVLWNSRAAKAADESTAFAGEKTAWHGSDRYDFLMDQKDLSVKPCKAAEDEGNGIKGQVD